MYQIKNYESLLGVEGLSDNLLKNHFTLYEGYVANSNKLVEKLEQAEAGTPEYGEMKRRFGWEFNGMRLHEYYFGNMSKEGTAIDENSKIYQKIVKQFGSFDKWVEDFKATGTMRGIGWVVLSYDEEADKIFNTWINEHDLGLLAGSKILLVMDVFEHAFMLDYGLKKADYINTFFNIIDWSIVESRLG